MKNSQTNKFQLVEEVNSTNDNFIQKYIDSELSFDLMKLFDNLIISSIFWGNYYLSIKSKIDQTYQIPIDQNYTYIEIMSRKSRLENILRKFLIYSKRSNSKNNLRINELLYKTLKIGDELLLIPDIELNYFIIKNQYTYALNIFIEIVEKIDLYHSTIAISNQNTFNLKNQISQKSLDHLRKIHRKNDALEKSIRSKNTKSSIK